MKIRKLKKRMKKQGYLSWSEYALITSRIFRREHYKFPHHKYVHQLIKESNI